MGLGFFPSLFFKSFVLWTHGAEARSVKKCLDGPYGGEKHLFLSNGSDRSSFLFFFFTKPRLRPDGGELGVSKSIRGALMGVKIPFYGMNGAGDPFLIYSHTLSVRIMGESWEFQNVYAKLWWGDEKSSLRWTNGAGSFKKYRKAMMGVKNPLVRNEWGLKSFSFPFTYVLRSNHGGEAGSSKYCTRRSDAEMENHLFDELMGLGAPSFPIQNSSPLKPWVRIKLGFLFGDGGDRGNALSITWPSSALNSPMIFFCI